jgi:hypothetical protein
MKRIKDKHVLVLVLGAVLVISMLCVTSLDVSRYADLQEESHLREAKAVSISDESVIILESPGNNSVLWSGTVIDIAIEESFSLSQVLFNWDGLGNNEIIVEPYEIPLPSGDGQHVLNVYAEDTEGNWESALFSFVTDDTSPLITSAEDISYTEGSTGHNIVWVLTDPHPACYSVYMDGSEIRCLAWFSGIEVSINVDGHTPGLYEYVIFAFDEVCNYFTDTVIVTVLEVTTTTTTPPETTTTAETTGAISSIPTVIDSLPSGTLPIALGLSGIIIVLNILVMRRRP